MSEELSNPVQPSKSLTLKPRRVAGSESCLNCGTALQGPFCHYCGQPDKRLVRFFPVLVREFFEDFLELDSRFTRTMKPLLFKPGRLTRDYLEGRRYRYTPPIRLFIFSSMLFFLLAATLAGNAIQLKTSGSDVNLSEADVGVISDLNDIETKSGEEQAKEEDADGPTFKFNEKEWDRETNPLIIPGMPDSFNEWINDEIERSPQKAEQIEENPNLIVEKFFELLPATMFIMLPIVALLFKFWYLFAKKYYIEHLIHALHNHAFIFVTLTITLLNNAMIEWRDPSGDSLFWQNMQWLNTAIYVWIPIYLLISLKTVYQQGWMLTTLKYCVIGISYILLLTFVTTIVALLGFLLL